jgi:hypothetical protein
MRLYTRLRLRAPLERAAFLIVLAALSGCDVPTELPIFDVRWVFPVEETSIAVTELLPPDVTVSGGNFDVVPDVVLSETLGSLCTPPTCVGSVVPVPKPAFSQTINQTGSLPADVVSVELVGGSISLAIENNLGFDPINPATAPADPGTMTVTLYDTNTSGRQLGQVMWDGPTNTLPTGVTTMVPIDLTAGTVSSTILAVLNLVSPAGDDVPIDLAASFIVTVGTVSVSEATLDVDGQTVSVDPTSLDVGDIDSDTVERIQFGSLIFDIQNPFDVGVTLDLDISVDGVTTVTKRVDIPSDQTSTVTVGYTSAELQSFLGQDVVLVSGSGAVVSPGVPATVTPTQVMVIAVNLDIELEIG